MKNGETDKLLAEKTALDAAIKANGVPLSRENVALLAGFCRLLLEENKKYNLTALKTPEDAAARHFADCLLFSDIIKNEFCAEKTVNKTLIDVGAGGGFPAVPLAVALPQVNVTALDSTAKKTAFVSLAAETLGIGNIRAVCGRAESLSKKPEYRAAFSVAVSRAVAPLDILAELCIPFLSRGGLFAAYKALGADGEAENAKPVFTMLGARLEKIVRRELVDPCSGKTATRALVLVRKIHDTPEKYPRPYSVIISHKKDN